MGILASWLPKIGIAGIFIDDDDVDISTAKGKDVIVESIPLSTHDWEGTIDFLLIDDDSLLIDVLDGGRLSVGVGGDHLIGIPKFERSILHTSEDQSMRICTYLD